MRSSDFLTELFASKNFDPYVDRRNAGLTDFVRNSPLQNFGRTTEALFASGNPEAIDDAIVEFLASDLGWVQDYFRAWIDGARSDFGYLPVLRGPLESNDGPISGVTVFQNNAVAMSVQSISPRELWESKRREGHENVTFTGQMAYYAVLSRGMIKARLWSCTGFGDGSDLRDVRCTGSDEIDMEPGCSYPVDGALQSLSFVSASEPAVILAIMNRTREVGSAVVLHSLSGDYLSSYPADRSATRRMFLSSALRHLGAEDRHDALLPGIAKGPFYQRWHVMREMVALDEEWARSPLTAMASGDTNPLVRKAAKATLDLINEMDDDNADHAGN